MGKRVLLVFGILFLIIIIFTSLVNAENLYVTQNGGGSGTSSSSPMSVSQFNSASKWGSGTGQISPGDTVYFSGTITSQVNPPGSGSPGNHVILDGYQAGDCDPIGTGPCPGAVIDRDTFGSGTSGSNVCMRLLGKAYLTVQDFFIRDCGPEGIQIYPDGNTWNHHINIFRNYIYHNYGANFNAYNVRHITVGGSDGNGNVFRNANYGSDFHNVGFGNGFEDIIFSYNQVYYDDPQDHPNAGNNLAIHRGSNILVEHNEIFGSPQETGISIKEYGADNVIVRFNNIHNNAPDGSGSEGSGISVTANSHDVYVYANYLHNNKFGMRFARGAHDTYAWSNIMHSNKWSGVWTYTDEDFVESYNIYFFNNVVAENAAARSTTEDTGFRLYVADTQFQIMNNIFYNNRKDRPEKHQFKGEPRAAQDVTLEHNTYYAGGYSNLWYWYWNGGYDYRSISTMQGWGFENENPKGQIADPRFQQTGSNQYSLASDSPCRSNGAIMSFSPGTINIEDGDGLVHNYDMSSAMSLGIDASGTDFTSFPPNVLMADRDIFGWGRGAYVYTGTSIPICSQGQITQTCLCGGVEYSSDFCCSNNWQSSECPLPPPPISQAGWSLLYVDSEELIYEDDAATNAFDNNANTFWHSEWYQNTDSHPHEIQIDLGANYILSSLSYLPRQDDENGRIASYEFYVSNDGNNWGSSVASGSFVNSASAQEITFSDVNARYIRLVALSEVNGEPWTSVAEINLFGELSSSTSQCSSGADTTAPYDIVSITELINYISSWKSGSVSINELINAIGEWKNGC